MQKDSNLSKGELTRRSRTEKLLTGYVPFPMCIIDEQGKVLKASKLIGEVFKYDNIKDADIFALTNIKVADIFATDFNSKNITLARNEKIFRLSVQEIDITNQKHAAVYFFDITPYENILAKYTEERPCVAIINVDNYDELTASTAEDKKLTLSTQIDKMIRQWAAKGDAIIVRYKANLYMMIFESSYMDKIVESKVSILDDIRSIETEADFPVTLSIGLGAGGENLSKTEAYALSALDLALGRGGDQAVVKTDKDLEYFGGKMQTVEKANKGKSRIIAHAVHQLMDEADKVVIMGHKNPDMDAFGAAIGMYRIAKARGKDAYIVINNYYDTLSYVYEQIKATEQYEMVNSEKAMKLVDQNTLLVVVDTHRPSLTECRELLDMTQKIVVIDHHRKAEEFIEGAILYYMEPYASSTCELVTEMLQYSGDKKSIAKLEAEVLLAGISMDTNRFAIKTGVRTFEAASWLRRSGADTAMVKRFFQTDIDVFKIRASCIANAEVDENGMAYSASPVIHPDIQVINAQAADELLTIKNVKASFVAGRNEKGVTIISARSLGDLNVQTIMEKLGGGGHLTTAGAQVFVSPEEALQEIKTITQAIFDAKKSDKEK